MSCSECDDGESLIEKTINRLVEEKAALRSELNKLEAIVRGYGRGLESAYWDSVNRLSAQERRQSAYG